MLRDATTLLTVEKSKKNPDIKIDNLQDKTMLQQYLYDHLILIYTILKEMGIIYPIRNSHFF